MAQPHEVFTPQADGEFLSVDQWGVDKKSRKKKVDTVDGIRFYKQQYTMANGTRYNAFSTVVPEWMKKTDVSSLETSGWLTSPLGMNKRRQINLGRLGVESTFVGVQQNFLRIADFEADAHHQLSIGWSAANDFDRDPQLYFMNGISRGAMLGLGATALARQHNMEILYNDAIVPCLPNGLDPIRDAKEIPGMIYDAIKHEGDPIMSIKDMPLRILRHYPQSADITGLFQQIKEVPSLLSGKVGELIDDHMDRDQFQYLSVFSGDALSQGRRWEKKLGGSDYPHTVVNHAEGGGHMSCVTPDSHEGWYGRWSTVVPIVAEHADTLRVLAPAQRHEVLHGLARAANPAFDDAAVL